MADWHDQRTAHPDPDAQWDRSNGRIYRIGGNPAEPANLIDFAQQTIQELIALHQNPSQWFVRHARQELLRREDPAAIAPLREQVAANDGEEAIEALWSLYSLGGLDESLARKLLDSHHRAVRYWTVRFLGEPSLLAGQPSGISSELAERLDELAEQEPDVWVRQQLACTAARLPAKQAIPIVNANIIRDIDNQDPYLPLLWWWAVERHSIEGREEVLRRFVRPSLWRSQLGRDFLLPRLIRRYAAEDTPAGFDSVVRLLKAAPDEEAQDKLWKPIFAGLQQTDRNRLPPPELAQIIAARWKSKSSDSTLTQLAMLCGNQAPVDLAIATAVDAKAATKDRVAALESLALANVDSLRDQLLELVQSEQPESVRVAALQVVARIEDPRVVATLIFVHNSDATETLKRQIRSVLLARRRSALAWLQAVDRGDVAASATPIEQIRQVALLDDPQLNALVRKHWGKLDAATREDALAEVRRLNNDLRAGTGDVAKGRLLFKQHCAACHQLFGEGKQVGPELTTANRADRLALLVSLVAPSSVIRKEYASIVVLTTDGRVLTGLPIKRDESGMTLVNQKGEATSIAANEIELTRDSNVSLMPADLYRLFTPQQLRDLFAWLQSSGPAK